MANSNKASGAEIRKLRRERNGAARRKETADRKIKAIRKEMKLAITSPTKRKIFRASLIEWLAKRDQANVDLALSSQKLNTHLTHNNRLNTEEWQDGRREKMRQFKIERLKFAAQTFFKAKTLPETVTQKLLDTIKSNDLDEFGKLVSDELSGSKTFRLKMPGDSDETRKPLLIALMKWFESRLGTQTAGEVPVNPVITHQ